MQAGDIDEDLGPVLERIAERAKESGARVAVAESLTSGTIAGHLGAAPGASEWFRGGVVSYADEVKFEVLGVDPGPVITDRCARQMVEGVARLMHADAAVAVTGVGGPGPTEGEPEGTVFLSSLGPEGVRCTRHRFAGDPSEIVTRTVHAALRELDDRLRAG